MEKGDWERAFADLNQALTLDPTNALASETPKTTVRLRSAYEQAVASLNQFKQLFRRAAKDIDAARHDLRLPELQPTTEARSTAPEQPIEVGVPLPTATIEVTPPPSTPHESRAPDPEKDSALTEEEQSRRHRRQAVRHCRKGQIFLKEGDKNRALAAYIAAIAVDPTCAEAYRERGLIHRRALRLDEALDDFNRAIELEPSAEIYYRRGVTYAKQRIFKLAVTDFDEAIERDPNHAAAYLNRGLISMVAGMFEKAVADAERAIEIDPSIDPGTVTAWRGSQQTGPTRSGSWRFRCSYCIGTG